MNEKLQYAEMLDIPSSTCTITFKPARKKPLKKKKSENAESVKTELINRINDREEVEVKEEITAVEEQETEKVKKPKFKFTVVGVQLAVIGALVATIILTNAFMPNSGLNVFFKNVFSKTETVSTNVDERIFTDFNPVSPVTNTEKLTVENGIMTMSGSGSVYSPCDGVVTELTFNEETKKYDITIAHNDNFKSVFNGIDYAYTEVGGSVFSNIPVGYVLSDATMCFCSSDGSVITNYTLKDNQVEWSV